MLLSGKDIFDRLVKLRISLEEHFPLTEQDNALLWDVARTLELTETQQSLLAGDVGSPLGQELVDMSGE